MNKEELLVKGIDEIPMFTFNTKTKEFSVLGHKFDGVNSIEDFINYIHNLDKENQQLQNDLDSANSKVSELANKLLQIETIIKYDLKYYEKDVVVRDLNTILKMIGSDK